MAFRINLPPVTRIVLISLLALSFLYNVARWRRLDSGNQNPIIPYLTLVPSQFYWAPWTLLTATFVEQNIFTVLLNGAALFYGGKYLERAWGSREFAKFILVIALVPNLLSVPFYLSWVGVTGNSVRGLTQICGGVSLQAAFLVAFKQLVPEHTVALLKGIVKMRVKHFPALFLLLNTLSGFIFGTDTAAILAWLGLMASWTYLRFYKHQPDLTGTSTDGVGIKGDASETFAFACFFPDAIQPPIAFVADQIYSALVALKVCTPFSEEEIASGNEQALARGQTGLPNLLNNRDRGSGAYRGFGKREEAERRRALALKALDQRLQAATAGRAAPAAQPPVTASSSDPSTGPGPSAAPPSVSAGQNMLGETTYTPDHA